MLVKKNLMVESLLLLELEPGVGEKKKTRSRSQSKTDRHRNTDFVISYKLMIFFFSPEL